MISLNSKYIYIHIYNNAYLPLTTDTNVRPRDITPNEVENNQTILIQKQSLDMCISMAINLKGMFYQK